MFFCHPFIRWIRVAGTTDNLLTFHISPVYKLMIHNNGTKMKIYIQEKVHALLLFEENGNNFYNFIMVVAMNESMNDWLNERMRQVSKRTNEFFPFECIIFHHSSVSFSVFEFPFVASWKNEGMSLKEGRTSEDVNATCMRQEIAECEDASGQKDVEVFVPCRHFFQ